MIQPIRIQRSRNRNQTSPNGLPIVYVGRPTKWGNPFKVVGEEGHWFVLSESNIPLITFYNKKDAISCCVQFYEKYAYTYNFIINNISDLTGKNLSCWCPLNCECHADVLLKKANASS